MKAFSFIVPIHPAVDVEFFYLNQILHVNVIVDGKPMNRLALEVDVHLWCEGGVAK